MNLKVSSNLNDSMNLCGELSSTSVPRQKKTQQHKILTVSPLLLFCQFLSRSESGRKSDFVVLKSWELPYMGKMGWRENMALPLKGEGVGWFWWELRIRAARVLTPQTEPAEGSSAADSASDLLPPPAASPCAPIPTSGAPKLILDASLSMIDTLPSVTWRKLAPSWQGRGAGGAEARRRWRRPPRTFWKGPVGRALRHHGPWGGGRGEERSWKTEVRKKCWKETLFSVNSQSAMFFLPLWAKISDTFTKCLFWRNAKSAVSLRGWERKASRHCVYLVPITLTHAGLFLSAVFLVFPWLTGVLWLLSPLFPLTTLLFQCFFLGA